MLQSLREIIRRLFTPTVDDCMASIGNLLAKLDKIAHHHSDQALDKRDFANSLHAEADEHDAEQLRALRVSSKIVDLLS